MDENGIPQTAPGLANSPDERRQHRRLATDCGAQCWKKGATTPVWGKLKDISLGGCFVDTRFPFPSGTPVTLLLTLHGIKLRTEGEVTFSQDDKGMGVRFTSLANDELLKLYSAVEYLSKPSPAGTKFKLQSMSTSDLVLVRLRQWFENHATLSKEEFLELCDLQKTTSHP